MSKPRKKSSSPKRVKSSPKKKNTTDNQGFWTAPGLRDFLFSGQPRSFFSYALLCAFVLLGSYLCWRHLFVTGASVFLAAVLLWGAEFFAGRFGTSLKLGFVVLGLVLGAEALSAVPDYGQVLPQGLALRPSEWSGVLFVCGFLLMVLGFRFSDFGKTALADLKPWQTYLALGVILVGGGAFTLAHYGEVQGYYWDDSAEIMLDVRATKELHFYSVIMPLSFREPAFNYLATFFWYLFSNETGVNIQRLASVFVYLSTIVAMYFLGAKVANHRTGILFAALGAFNKWLPTETLWGYGLVLNPLMISLSLLIIFYIFEKPTWFRFILWGLTIGLGTYTYAAYRPFDFFMAFIPFAWIILSRKKWNNEPAGWILGSAVFLFWNIFFLTKNNLISDLLLTDLLKVQWLLCLALAILLGWSLYGYFKKQGENGVLIKFSMGLFVAFFSLVPLVTNQAYGMRVAQLSAFQAGASGGSLLVAFLGKVDRSIHEIFMGQGFWGDSAFDFQSTWIILLGLAFFFGKPNWKAAILFLAAALGIAPHVLSHDEYNGRALASVAPLLLLGAIGMDQLYVWGRDLWSGRQWNLFFTFLSLAFFGWQALSNYQMIFTKWFYHQGGEVMVSRQVAEDSPRDLVYLSLSAGGVSPGCQGVLDEGHPLFVLQNQNPIYLTDGEKPKDVVVIDFGDPALKKRLETEFPKAEWTGVSPQSLHYPAFSSDGLVPRFSRVLIPADQISNNARNLFYYVRVPDHLWTRDFYWQYYGLAHGTILAEDKVPSLRAPYPTTQEVRTAKFEGFFRAPVDGRYLFSANDQNYVYLSVGNKKVLDMRSNGSSPVSASGSVVLNAGIYPISYSTYFRDNQIIPSVFVLAPGATQTADLDSFAR